MTWPCTEVLGDGRVGVLDGFNATWSQARQTYGEGTPQTGERFDASSTLDQLRSDMDGAAPAGHWRGDASQAYGAANTEHQRVIGAIGDLDKRLGAQVTTAANLVSSGRTDLESLRKWVNDAAASAPDNEAGRRMQMTIVSKGLGQLTDIIKNTDAGMQTVKGNLDTLKGEYTALGTGQRFAPREGPELGAGKEDEKTDDHSEMHALSPEEQAKRDVAATLSGDEGAAARVEDVLGSIQPGQDLSPAQDAYLSQMQSQQKGMGVSDLAEAEQRLGEHRNVIADSWQLMSNDDVYFSGAGDDKHGSASQLPDSVQKTLQQADVLSGNRGGDMRLVNADDLNRISEIVQHGDSSLQTGTELDREMIRASDRVMDKYFPGQIPTEEQTTVAQNIFESAGRDHQIVHDHMLGTHGDNGDDFLHDINTIDWPDDGKAAGSLIDWTHDAATTSESDIASATAEKYAQYVGSHKNDLMSMSGGQTLGELNPELVKGYAHGLTPYMADIASLSSGNPNDQFGFLDQANPERPVAKGLFSVLATQQDAYAEFNGAADQLALDRAHQYAEDVKHGVDVRGNDPRLLEGAVLRGLVDSGSAEAAHALNLSNAEAHEWRKQAYNVGVTGLSAVSGPVGGPLVSTFGAAMESSFIGQMPDTTRATIPDIPAEESARFVVNALLAEGVDVQGLNPNYMIDGRVASLEELSASSKSVPADVDMQADLNRVLEDVVGKDDSPAEEYAKKYEQITKVPNAK